MSDTNTQVENQKEGGTSKGNTQQQALICVSFAPAKIYSKPVGCSQNVCQQQNSTQLFPGKNTQDKVEVDSVDKVDIPDTFVESDAESDTLSEKLRKIDAYNANTHADSQDNGKEVEQQVWLVNEDAETIEAHQQLNAELHDLSKLAPSKEVVSNQTVLEGNS